MDDDQIILRGGDDYEIDQYAKQNGADMRSQAEIIDDITSTKLKLLKLKAELKASGFKAKRGFACMSPKKIKEIAAKGGSAPHKGKRGFARLSREENRRIASLGGSAIRI